MSEARETAAEALWWVYRAAHGPDPVLAILQAAWIVWRSYASGVISETARDLILEALPPAQDALSRAVPNFDLLHLENGFRALAGLVMVWAEDADATARRDAREVADWCDYGRIFVNQLDSVALLAEIKVRASAAQAPVVAVPAGATLH